MKPRQSKRRVAVLLLLLCLCVGGVGVFVVSTPSVSAAISRLLGWTDSGDDDDIKNAVVTGSENGLAGGNSGNGPTSGHDAGKGFGAFKFDPHALPKGLKSIDGEGGTGIDRAVKKNGVWYPVYSPGLSKNGGQPPFTEIPLTIASGSLPIGKAGVPYEYQAEAIGGTEPYVWSATLSAMSESFVFDPSMARLAGTSLQPGTAIFTLTVKDAADATASVQMQLVMRPEKELALLTSTLPNATLDEDYNAPLEAIGGVPPYRWAVSGSLPAGLTLGAETGTISGIATEAGDHVFKVTVTDSQNAAVEKELSITATEGLEIITEASLDPVRPGQAFQFYFEATGGVPPLTWGLTEASFPDNSWVLSADGILNGTAPSQEQIISFTLTVKDSLEATFQKTFHLAVSDLLIAQPSLEKVGLAWSPAAVNSLLGKSGLVAASFSVERDGIQIYQGSGTNLVDHNQPAGTSPSYTLVAFLTDGSSIPIATKSVTILPMTLGRAQAGVNGDPFADKVSSFQPLVSGGYGYSQLPLNVTGPPDGKSTYGPASKASEVASLQAKVGGGGAIELEFADNIVELGPGEDLTVFENVLFVGGNGNSRFMEPAIVSVALFPGEWHKLPTDVIPPADGSPLNLMNPFYYARGIAGRNGTTGDDPTNPAKSGGDSFDLNQIPSATGLTWIRYIRIQSTGDHWMTDDAGSDTIRHNADPAFRPLTGMGNSGFDLDAVSAAHY